MAVKPVPKRKKAYVLIFINQGEKLPERPLEECDLEFLELPMAKLAELENTQLIDMGNKTNKLYKQLEKWLKIAKQVMQTRWVMPEVGNSILAEGTKAEAIISCEQQERFNKDAFIAAYGEDEYNKFRLPGDPFYKVKLQDKKDPA
jgi:hypothetical protein